MNVSPSGRYAESRQARALGGARVFDYAVSVSIFATACLVCWAMGLSDDGAWLPVIYTGSAGAALYLWLRMRWPSDAAKYLSFGGIALLTSVVFHLLAFIDYLNTGEQFSDWPFPVADPVAAVAKGQVMSFLGTIASVAVWQSLGGLGGSAQPLFETTNPSTARFFLIAYIVSIATAIASIPTAESLQVVGHAIPILVALGASSVLVLPRIWAKNPTQRLLFSFALSLPFVVVALGSGMKSQILIAALPVGMNAWTYFRSTLSRLLLIAVTLSIVTIVTSYVGYFRNEVWLAKRDVPASQVLGEFVDNAERDPAGTMTNGLDSFTARANMTFFRAWAVSLADEHQLEPELVLAPLLYLLIPRALWPEKPVNNQAQEYTILVFGVDTSSTAIGLYTGFYLAAGWLGVVCGTLLVGASVAAGQVVARRLAGPLLEATYVIVLLPMTLNFSESWPIAVVMEPIFALVYLCLIYFPLQLMSPKLSATKAQ